MDQKVIIGATAGISACIGAFAGWNLAMKKAEKVFDELLSYELKEAAKFYEKINKVGDFATPEAAAQTLVGEAAEAVVNYSGKFVPVEDVELTPDGVLIKNEEAPVAPPEEQEHNIWADAPDAYLISSDEFNANETEYEQISATYYEGDSVVTDDEDKPLADVDRCVGIGNLAQYGDGHIIYVRNDRLSKDYMIAKSTGSYAKEVLGLDGLEEESDDELQHSDGGFQRMPRRRHLRDD
jgi:hypothetical protein